MVEDPSYAAYVMPSPGELRKCPEYENCKVVAVPYIVDTVLGFGWIFPKGSPYLPTMSFYASSILERGIYGRMVNSYYHGAADQTCKAYDGEPIGVHKAFSLCAIIFLGVGLSLSSLL